MTEAINAHKKMAMGMTEGNVNEERRRSFEVCVRRHRE